MNANQMLAGYLFQPDKHYELALDTGDKTIQCGRHIDILKLWLTWKARGLNGYAEHIELLLDNANFLYETVRTREPYFRMLMKVEHRSNKVDLSYRCAYLLCLASVY
jgi:glutamate/tyrosine decarboxylase-like PLP-dependent enzyme